MKALIVGFGSAGKRIAQILKESSVEYHIVSSHLAEDVSVYRSLEDFFASSKDVDVVFIANKTSDHFQAYASLRKHGFQGDIIVEKPIGNHLSEWINIQDSKCFTYYNLRFHPLVNWLKSEIKNKKIILANFYVGQYLPSWRPGTDYRSSYSAKKNEGGGVLRDLSHELDLCQYLLGRPHSLVALGGKCSSLEIDSDDHCTVMLNFAPEMSAHIEMNYIDRITQRWVILHSNEATYKIDFISNTAQKNEQTIKIDSAKDESHRKIINAVINRNYSEMSTLSEAVFVMKEIEEIEQSIINQNWRKL